ncbi:FAD/NAD(P)-binding protein [Chlorogloea sp. CCALA 695]|uniref:FAD/NAD(P)-binding protein n=1 Tax=Chlorogloea sp. CCALA 695 TaxID=2107693 RepID=UPI000D076F3F|nr:FAD/NAD(P)-binding protein [Chlorogloea sp. CCALA 695]PSB26528.1 FAD-dependent oxidoreductase [Chlorogloea sp. CCALA 695]
MSVTSVSIPNQTDIAIVGAGPHALTLVTHLLKKRSSASRFLVFEESGTWLHQWQHQFAALEIPHLRSPVVHHPDPNPYALRKFAELRSDELFPPYDLPGTKLFQDFCNDVIRRFQLQERVVKAKVVRIEPLFDKFRRRFRLWLLSGQSVIARRVVFASGSGSPQLPDWVSRIESDYPQERLLHSQQVDLRGLHLAGERVLIVGGGQTCGHLVVGATNCGAEVQLIVRRQLQEKLFDAEPGWLGPKYLKGFRAQNDWEKRWELIQQARDGGSMTPAMMTQLRRLMRNNQLNIYQQCQIVKAMWQANSWRVYCHDGTEYECDRIWLATGTRLNIMEQPLLAEILDAYPLSVVNGLPVLDEYLRWRGCELFVMGGLAGLQVGPVARNLSGARMAGERIVPALTKFSITLSQVKTA